MNDSSSQTPVLPLVRLGIQGLPHLTDSMLAGGLYFLVAETPPARFPILAASLGSALEDGRVCSVVVATNPELFLDRIESFGHLDARAVLRAGRLNLFEMQSEFPKKMFRFGADSFVRELEQFDIPEDSYLLFDQADELLALHDISLALDQVEVLRHWFERRRVTALLVFSRATAAHAATINALMDNLTGLTRLGGDRDGLELTFDYWQSPDGTIAARNYRLLRLDSGFYEASTRLLAPEQAAGEGTPEIRPAAEVGAEDAEPHFFFMDPDLGSLAKQLPGIWQRVDTLVSMMHATRGTRSATCILSFHRGTNLRQLAEAVHTLRLTLGRRTRIVVQEKGASLRYQNEALLVRLGINLVVHRDVPAIRLPLLLESLSGQIFNRDVDINFEAALASVLPTRLRGYVAPRRFVREVDTILDRADTLNIPCALVVGKPALSLSVEDIIKSCSMSRPGDLISSDGELCYLFLNACPQSALLATLQRMFGMDANDALKAIRFMVSRDEIQPELAALSRADEQYELPDYAHLVSAAPEPDDLPAYPGTDEPAFSDTLPPLVDTYTRHTISAISAGRTAAPATPFRLDPEPKAASAASPAVGVEPAKETAAKPVPMQADLPRFSYGQAPTDRGAGMKELPRATRSTPAACSTAPQKDDPIDPAGL